MPSSSSNYYDKEAAWESKPTKQIETFRSVYSRGVKTLFWKRLPPNLEIEIRLRVPQEKLESQEGRLVILTQSAAPETGDEDDSMDGELRTSMSEIV